MRFFNTAGPINPKLHYYIPNRLDEIELQQLIDQQKYFILHAPRQSGKTTAIKMFVDEINRQKKYTALYVNVEPAQAARNDFIKGLFAILNIIKIELSKISQDHTMLAFFDTMNTNQISGSSLYECLTYLSLHSNKPIILFIDEIDSLVGDTLISVLRQLRAGYINRPEAFPQSVCLIGVRDVRDYRIWSTEENAMVLGGSAFNIKAESLTLPNFSLDQVRMLYEQHTQNTSQRFTDEAIEYAFYLTQGQPWLVNALAYQACFVDITDRNIDITHEIIDRAKETLIKRCDTHIDQLIHKLQEPRVRTIIDAIINTQSDLTTFPSDDVQYVRDLGLIKPHDFDIANPIYQEIIPRALAQTTSERIRESALFYQNPDGSLNVDKLLEKFTEFYRENSTTWLADFQYKESGPHLLVMAFLQRIINGGGSIHREYALDRKRVDLLISWPYFGLLSRKASEDDFYKISQNLQATKDMQLQRIVVELKILRGSKTLEDGLWQTAEYMDISNATEGHLIIFDRDVQKSWEKKIYHRIETIDSKKITVWGL